MVMLEWVEAGESLRGCLVMTLRLAMTSII